jgi:hypothetical protein
MSIHIVRHNFTTPRTSNSDAAYITLWSHVLAQAFDDLVSQLRADLASSESHPVVVPCEALSWFRSDARGIGSFMWICELLGVNAASLRCAAIRQAQKKATQKPKRRHSV